MVTSGVLTKNFVCSPEVLCAGVSGVADGSRRGGRRKDAIVDGPKPHVAKASLKGT